MTEPFTQSQYQSALIAIQNCLGDDEDGHGYLWDMMRTNQGKMVVQALTDKIASLEGAKQPAPPPKMKEIVSHAKVLRHRLQEANRVLTLVDNEKSDAIAKSFLRGEVKTNESIMNSVSIEDFTD